MYTHTHTHKWLYMLIYDIYIHIYGYAEAEAPTLWPPDGQADSSEKTLMLGGEGVNRGQDGWMASSTPWT